MFRCIINIEVIMLSASYKKTKDSREIIVPVFYSENRTLDAQNLPRTTSDKSPVVINKHTREYEYITYKCAVENLSKSSERHLNEKKFLDKNDKETQLFIDEIQKEIIKHIPLSSVEDIKLRGRKDKSFTAWLLLHKDSEPFKIDESFLENASCYANPKVTAVTLLNSPEEERGLRISLDKNKCRLYEVVNGSYKIQFDWKVGDEDCSIAMNISSNGTVTCDNLNKDLTFEDLEENKDVKIRIGGVKNKEMTLAELVSLGELLCRSSSEEIKVLSQENSKIKSLVEKNPEVKSALKEFASEVQEESSESMKPLTDMTKADVKGSGSSIGR